GRQRAAASTEVERPARVVRRECIGGRDRRFVGRAGDRTSGRWRRRGCVRGAREAASGGSEKGCPNWYASLHTRKEEGIGPRFRRVDPSGPGMSCAARRVDG